MAPAYSVRRSAVFVFYNLAATLVLLLVVEGVASVVYSVHKAFAVQPLSERLHTEYDRELGWVNLPNVYIANLYGPGKYLRTNSQRFRNNADFAVKVPPGKARIICSGDSFTLGSGVDNDHTWPQLLASHAKNIETVNMGQAGYGADQAYLWYKRDGVKLDHDIHIFAFIVDDFRRMQSLSFIGYGKPILVVENNRLVTKNVPVPVQRWSPGLRHAQDAMNNLLITRLLRSVLWADTTASTTQAQTRRNAETLQVLSYMFDDLAETNRAKNSVPVLAYLPSRWEGGGSLTEPWRKFLAEYARQRGLLYLDFVDDFDRLSPEELDKLFIAGGGAANHYTEAGHALIADLIYRRLLANQETAAKLHIQSASDAATLRPARTMPR